MNMDWKEELLGVCEILKNNGVDIKKIPTRVTKGGKRCYILLSDIKQDGININQIIKTNNLDENMPIGKKIKTFKSIYVGTTKGTISEEEKNLAEKLELVEIIPKERQKPIFKGMKISQFHIDIVNKYINEMLSGRLNIKEVMQIINEKAEKENETQIRDLRTIKRIVEIVLKDNPEKLEEFYEKVKHNTGRRINREKIYGAKTGMYYEKEEMLKEKIIQEYLPLILSGEITFEIIENELQMGHKKIDEIIKEDYLKSGNIEGLKQYEEAKKRNKNSVEARKKAKEMRREIEKYEVVTNKEFILLSPEEQDQQLLMKIRQGRLIEEKSSKQHHSKITSEEYTLERINLVKDFFRKKNLKEEELFSESDIRYIIFRFPTIVNRDSQMLDKKIQNLLAYDEIDEKIASVMIKTFPAIMGYDVIRIKKQLDLLKKENLMDVAINYPSKLMMSPSLMYALIEYAKERHKTTDLSDITRTNIFMPNSTLKRLYGVTHEEIKEKYPYSEIEEVDTPYEITGEDFGKASIKDMDPEEVKNATNVITGVIKQSNKGEKND